MRVLVCSGRNFRDEGAVWHELSRLHAETAITEIMQGDATDADSSAAGWAASKRIKCWGIPARWAKFGKAAGPIRNSQMLDWKPDLVVAFPGGRGTADMIHRAEAAGIRVVQAGGE